MGDRERIAELITRSGLNEAEQGELGRQFVRLMRELKDAKAQLENLADGFDFDSRRAEAEDNECYLLTEQEYQTLKHPAPTPAAFAPIKITDKYRAHLESRVRAGDVEAAHKLAAAMPRKAAASQARTQAAAAAELARVQSVLDAYRELHPEDAAKIPTLPPATPPRAVGDTLGKLAAIERARLAGEFEPVPRKAADANG
jgi:hypothetical protein